MNRFVSLAEFSKFKRIFRRIILSNLVLRKRVTDLIASRKHYMNRGMSRNRSAYMEHRRRMDSVINKIQKKTAEFGNIRVRKIGKDSPGYIIKLGVNDTHKLATLLKHDWRSNGKTITILRRSAGGNEDRRGQTSKRRQGNPRP